MIRSDAWNELESGTKNLYLEMVEAHLAADPASDRRFIQIKSWNGPEDLGFQADRNRHWIGIPSGSLAELSRLRLVTVAERGRDTVFYRISGESLEFHRQLIASEISAIDQLDGEVRRSILEGHFGRSHTKVAEHINTALNLTWSDDLSEKNITAIGHELRQAIYEFAEGYSSETTRGAEEPIDRLRQAVAKVKMSKQERNVVDSYLDLVRHAYRLDERLEHIRKEAERGEPFRAWPEARRAVRATTFALVEVAALLDQGA